jgi:hypothetical protein
MLAAAAVVCGRESPLADNNAAHNRASNAPTIQHQPRRGLVPLPHSGAPIGTRLGLRRIEHFAIQVAAERTQCGTLRLCIGVNCRGSSQQSLVQAKPPVVLTAFARPRVAVFVFLILHGPSWTTLRLGVHENLRMAPIFSRA